MSSVVSDLLGVSARRMLQALADGETDPAALAQLAAPRLRATPEQLRDAFHASATLHPVYRRLLTFTLEELRMIEDQLGQLDQQMADLLTAHHDAVQRLAEVPGLGVDSAQQIIAEVGATPLLPPVPQRQSADETHPSTKPPTPRRKQRGRPLPSSTVGSSHASAMRKRLGPSPTDSARARAVRGTGTGRQRRGEEGADLPGQSTGQPRNPAVLLYGTGHLPFGPAGFRQALRLQVEQRIQPANHATAIAVSHMF